MCYTCTQDLFLPEIRGYLSVRLVVPSFSKYCRGTGLFCLAAPESFISAANILVGVLVAESEVNTSML